MRQPRREVANVGLHGGMPESLKMKGVHFAQRLLRRPTVESDAVHGNEYAGTIAAKPAVDEDALPRLLLNERKKLSNLFIFRWSPAIAFYVDEMHAEGFRARAFGLHGAAALASEIDNHVDTKFVKGFKSFLVGLTTTIKKVVDLGAIGNTWKVKGLGENGLLGGRIGLLGRSASVHG